MKILTASQIRAADAYTIAHEPVASVDLMERAAKVCTTWLSDNYPKASFKIFCGPGNNGGDGLAIARQLLEKGFSVSVYVVNGEKKFSQDFIENENRLRRVDPSLITLLDAEKDFPEIDLNDCIVDALFGTGLSKPLTNIYAKLVKHLNKSDAPAIAIDIPSGLFSDKHVAGKAIVEADHTLTFQLPKFSFLFPENEKYVGAFHVLDIGLNEGFIASQTSSNHYLDRDLIKSLILQRRKFSHKGDYGHAMLAAGGEGKMGAAVLAARACLRSGVGLLSMLVPEQGRDTMQICCPEAMLVDEIDYKKFSIGIGPGIGTGQSSRQLLKKILKHATTPVVLDADALNILALDKNLLKKVPPYSILTPHPGEFRRLTGPFKNDFERHEGQLAYSKKHKVIMVLKGAHTCITTPDGNSYFNSTGNPGMAKGGSGDVLTGMITALLAQKYEPLHAAITGVYLHGLAGDLAAEEIGMDGMIAGDVVERIAEAWKGMRTR